MPKWRESLSPIFKYEMGGQEWILKDFHTLCPLKYFQQQQNSSETKNRDSNLKKTKKQNRTQNQDDY